MKHTLLVAMLALVSCNPIALDRPTLERARTIATGVESTRLMSDVEALELAHLQDVPLECQSGYPNSHLCHLTRDKAREFVVTRLQSLGLEITIDSSEASPPTHNVFAELRGTEKPDEVIQIGAHFDAFYSGSDDNSSGVAVVLEVARLLAHTPLKRTVRFVGYDLEELGLIGSTRMAQSQSVARRTLVLDCVGYADSTPNSQQGLPGFAAPTVANFLAVIGNDISRGSIEILTAAAKDQPGVVPLYPILAPGRGLGPLTGNLMRSDHAPLWLAGENAVFFADTSNFRNPNYHTKSDTPDTLSPEFLAGVARVATMTIVSWADMP